MNGSFCRPTLLTMFLSCLTFVGSSAAAADRFVGPSGRADGEGTRESPWDLESALGGRQKIAPGDTLWILAGTYKHPNRSLESPGYAVRLTGEEGKPIQFRADGGQRVTIDGGLTVLPPSAWLWIRDLEIVVSENVTTSRVLNEPGSHPKPQHPYAG